MDTYFEHYKQHSLIREFIVETYRDLSDEDYFGLLVRQDVGHAIEGQLDINLEQKSKNMAVKEKILAELQKQENPEPRPVSNSYMKQQLANALAQSTHVPEKTVKCQDLEFVSPIKWVVAFIGSLKGLLNTGLLNIQQDNTNLLVVYFTDETPELATVNEITKMIQQSCQQGGLMIVRHRETAV